MALVKIILESGGTVEVETASEQADDLVAAFARFVFEARVPEKRTSQGACASGKSALPGIMKAFRDFSQSHG